MEIAIILNLREPAAAKYYIECWKLKRSDKLYSAYIEVGDEDNRILRCYTDQIKQERKYMRIEQIVRLLQLVDEDRYYVKYYKVQ
jgi:hypothetical protein